MNVPGSGSDWDSETVRFGPDSPETVRFGEPSQPTQRFESAPAQPRQTRRFGPGVPATPPPPAWSTATRSARPVRRRRWRVALSTLVTLAIAAGVFGYLWWSQQDPLEVTGATVAPVEPSGDQCDITMDVVGTIHTNGNHGTVTYQWIRSDGETTAVLKETVLAGDSSVQVHLFWQFSGEGTYHAAATLRILEPTRTEASTEFTYQCRPAG